MVTGSADNCKLERLLAIVATVVTLYERERERERELNGLKILGGIKYENAAKTKVLVSD